MSIGPPSTHCLGATSHVSLSREKRKSAGFTNAESRVTQGQVETSRPAILPSPRRSRRHHYLARTDLSAFHKARNSH
jgi:hypothetical protein